MGNLSSALRADPESCGPEVSSGTEHWETLYYTIVVDYAVAVSRNSHKNVSYPTVDKARGCMEISDEIVN